MPCLLLGGALSSCKGPAADPGSPDGAYQLFYQELATGRFDLAMARLSQASRERLGVVGAELLYESEREGEPFAFLVDYLWEQQLAGTQSMQQPKVLRRDDQGAVLEVMVGQCDDPAKPGVCKRSEVRMVFEQGQWRVELDLPPTLESRLDRVRNQKERP